MQRIDLTGKWKFKAVDVYKTLPRGLRSVLRWMPAKVPGTVHTDLLAYRKIPDPFYRMNEKDVQWVDQQQWVYKREFTIPTSLLTQDAIQLVCEGLDTYAQIRINGKVVGETSNMFVEHRLDVKRYLRPGKNTIKIVFDSPSIRPKAVEKKHGALRVALEPHRVYVRKAQYSYGWDWGPKLTTSGIWRNISLELFSHARLVHPHVKVLTLNSREAVVQVSVEVERVRSAGLSVRMLVTGEQSYAEQTSAVRGNTVRTTFRIAKPKLWWPNGYGGQPMYDALFSLRKDGREIHRLEVPFGLRIVHLVQEKDTEGKSFIIEINGKKIYCKGANWIPCDTFIPRIADSTYRTLLHLAKDAHMNMIRVWGGGIYEQDIFYTLCDRLGLMVWQDFMYACGEYPEQPWFLKQSKEEAEKVAKRLRNHPGIVVWCGNNECEYDFCAKNPGKTPDDLRGAKIFRDILPSVVARHDGTRPYWRSSPFGEGFPNAESNGTHHQWTVWDLWKDYREYENDNARFVAEFGFQAPANRETFDEVSVPSDRHPQSRFMEHHNKKMEGPERLFRFLSAHYRVGTSFDDFIYKGQLVQGDALKFAVEHWRRRKFKTAGSLFWQLNDCWPVSSWAVIDAALRPKAGYYFAKRFFAPVLLSFKKSGNALEVWVTNDALKAASVTLDLGFRSFVGKRIWAKRLKLHVRANSSSKVCEVDLLRFAKHDSARHYFSGRLLTADGLSSEQRYFLHEPKHLLLPKTKLTTLLTTPLTSGKDGEWTLNIKSTHFAKNVRVEIRGEDVFFDDNYFDIDAGGSKVVRFRSGLTTHELKKRLKLKWIEYHNQP
ncbi:MAG TPA: glycoside hydrolase family 2 protein [Bacteroidota bacterium]|nr:glycoside hydrolase family 2 protein [Bacteroidota bacterium]